jgi:hypothetical protein
MDLFDISSEESKHALLEYATDLYGERTGVTLLVKGRDFEKCQSIYNFYGPFGAAYGYCYFELYSFCVYNNPNPADYIEEPSSFKRKFIKYKVMSLLQRLKYKFVLRRLVKTVRNLAKLFLLKTKLLFLFL